jgi:hypothetical protein
MLHPPKCRELREVNAIVATAIPIRSCPERCDGEHDARDRLPHSRMILAA